LIPSFAFCNPQDCASNSSMLFLRSSSIRLRSVISSLTARK